MNRLAKNGAGSIPIGIPIFCRNNFPPTSKYAFSIKNLSADDTEQNASRGMKTDIESSLEDIRLAENLWIMVVQAQLHQEIAKKAQSTESNE